MVQTQPAGTHMNTSTSCLSWTSPFICLIFKQHKPTAEMSPSSYLQFRHDAVEFVASLILQFKLCKCGSLSGVDIAAIQQFLTQIILWKQRCSLLSWAKCCSELASHASLSFAEEKCACMHSHACNKYLHYLMHETEAQQEIFFFNFCKKIWKEKKNRWGREMMDQLCFCMCDY